MWHCCLQLSKKEKTKVKKRQNDVGAKRAKSNIQFF